MMLSWFSLSPSLGSSHLSVSFALQTTILQGGGQSLKLSFFLVEQHQWEKTFFPDSSGSLGHVLAHEPVTRLGRWGGLIGQIQMWSAGWAWRKGQLPEEKKRSCTGGQRRCPLYPLRFWPWFLIFLN